MTYLHIEHRISDFPTWKAAFDRDPLDRKGSGVRSYRVFQPVDDPEFVKIELEFDGREPAEAFIAPLEELWKSNQAAPALAGRPNVSVVEQVHGEDLG